MREIKFEYVIEYEGHIYITAPYMWNDDYGLPCKEQLMEDLEESEGIDSPCYCLNESCNHCECSPIFEDWDKFKIIAQRQYLGINDKDNHEIYDGDIVCILYPKSDYEIQRLQDKNINIEIHQVKGRTKKYVRFTSQAIPIKWSDKDARWVLGERRKSKLEYGTFGMNGGRQSIRGKTYLKIGNIYENAELLNIYERKI